jgi:hypothetical protein
MLDVFEYPLRANFKADFSNGITTIQCCETDTVY